MFEVVLKERWSFLNNRVERTQKNVLDFEFTAHERNKGRRSFLAKSSYLFN